MNYMIHPQPQSLGSIITYENDGRSSNTFNTPNIPYIPNNPNNPNNERDNSNEHDNSNKLNMPGILDASLTPEQLDYSQFLFKGFRELSVIKNGRKPQPFQYYLCFDVEATCEAGTGFDFKHEIIEFPMLLIDSSTFEIVDVFHSYVKPSVNPILSDFCIKLTGIPQTTINTSPSFPEMLCKFQEFLHSHQLFYKNSCAFMTDGPWDIRDFIRKQCFISKISRPSYFTLPWVDVRQLFASFYRIEKLNISGMLAKYGLKFEGREHSGIDDAKNLSIIAKRMWEDGVIFKTNRNLNWEIKKKKGNGKKF
ncbi:2163_t:CDS:2 [Diversispora eburnea]|uniref:2163_t:CDS:1 n=1 Tax=Diversispora eburnea TaxID=1213867 RepID=A0A9N8YQ01_9GLOM|nr:2163_t:CDS:2 [Diversispora eburnea]